MLAAASEGVILAFNVRPVGDARQIAEREGVEIRSYAVIYRAIEELRAAMQGMLEPEEVETPLGQAEVRQLFRASRIGIDRGLLSHRGQDHARRESARRARGHGHLRHDDREPAPLQRRRARGHGGLRVRHRARQLPGPHEGDVLETYETRLQERELSVGSELPRSGRRARHHGCRALAGRERNRPALLRGRGR